MIYTNLTLGELLSSDNETIKRNAVSILKQLQKKEVYSIGSCPKCGENTNKSEMIKNNLIIQKEFCLNEKCAYQHKRIANFIK